MANKKIKINRAPVLTLWAAVVAERLGYHEETALTLGKAVAGLNAQSKGRRLGIYEEKTTEERDDEKKKEKPAKLEFIEIVGRGVPTVKTPHGLRASIKGEQIDPQSVTKYSQQKLATIWTKRAQQCRNWQSHTHPNNWKVTPTIYTKNSAPRSRQGRKAGARKAI